MVITIVKGLVDDRITIKRRDGSEAHASFPKKGAVPHDAVHFVVERAFGLNAGFFATVASGRHPDEIAAMAKAAGHASASRAEIPHDSIVQLVQAERLVECFEADLWGGGSRTEDFVAAAEAGCALSCVALPVIPPGAIERVRAELAAFARDWVPAPVGHRAVLDWD